MAKIPQLPGLAQDGDKPKIVLAQDINYPPFAFLGNPNDGNNTDLSGIIVDVVKGMNEVCDLEILTVQTDWEDCWQSAGKIGLGLAQGHYHGCMSYTHTRGVRDRQVDFTNGILNVNKPAGLLVRLTESGRPEISPHSDLSGLTVVDVARWAPTEDGLAFVKNDCSGGKFSGYTMVSNDETKPWFGRKNGESWPSDLTLDNPNDVSLAMLLDKTVDAVWIYADMAYEYQCDDPTRVDEWNCDLWDSFGEKFAYLHTGMFEHAINGTTLAMTKKGSRLSEILNPCLEKFMRTKEYKEVCQKYDMEDECYPNEHFAKKQPHVVPWALKTSKLSTNGFACTHGYCSCSAKMEVD